ncbi:MAG: formamidopyrimidine-DNA glycosylase [Gammaproteobacteria bacterium]|nr:formamidopyrimidine-DNA glycosylase [Gammaproteobacteria bacterium]MYG11955.1 formamidopyrimidine-DNA glycosylase [Gammaproteobacteria bacterium]MYH15271.1 formamidopyrimidine-DNA glycosylase [Gammaproteobacteria bacterium]MYK27082.1 formamidopyrimidine-DNA glycosylase [Gammaproteobacteria bacterium]MYK82481.1 formamidopyrimidine-DNA glycosylase [Gammaproteobacteria bacterium]
MPEMPDLTVYLEHLEARLAGATLDGVRLKSPFVLRSVTPGVDEVCGLRVRSVSRLAKQIVLELEGDCFMVMHLMISGRLQWRAEGVRKPGRNVLALFDFSTGTLVFTEASKKKRAALRLVRGRAALAALDPGGLEVLQADLDAFADRLRNANHTLKRALTDQRVLAGIGNAYSDEILLTAGMSPFKRAGALSDEEAERLFSACRSVLTEWTERLRREAGDKFPAKVTAFHKEMAVHGKYRQPCPRCGSPVQRIVYAENEANYCARCQTDGRLLADRSLSRLLKDNWPKRLEDLE